MLLDEHFDADAILRDPEGHYDTDDHNKDDEEIKELELGNPHRLHDMDVISDDDEYL